MELRLHHIIHIYNVFRGNDGKDSDNCAQLLEKEFNKIYGVKMLDDGHDCNIASLNSLNIHDANDMQSHKLGDAMFDEYDLFSPQVLMSKFIMMIACLLSMMIMLMKVCLEECQL